MHFSQATMQSISALIRFVFPIIPVVLFLRYEGRPVCAFKRYIILWEVYIIATLRMLLPDIKPQLEFFVLKQIAPVNKQQRENE